MNGPPLLLGEQDTKPVLGVLERSVGYHIACAAVAAYGLYEARIGKASKLRKSEYSLMMLLLANGALSPKQLSGLLMVTSPKLTMLLDRLQERGWISRERNPRDGRSQHIVLTARGRRQAQTLQEQSASMEQSLLQVLSPAEHAMLIELLRKVARGGATS